MNYVRKLGFEETPDYDFLRELFTKVMKTIGEPEDGVYDWMILNGGKGWEASAVCFASISLDHPRRTKSVSKKPHVHSSATPGREHRRERDAAGHRRASRQLPDNAPPLVLSPAPAHVGKTRRPNDRGNSREANSVQPLVSASRRPSQQRDINPLGTSGLATPHPYAVAPNAYRTSTGAAYGRHSPNGPIHHIPNGNALHPNVPEPYSYGREQMGKPGATSRENMAGNGPPVMAAVRGMGMYDGDHMQPIERDEDGHGRRRGFWSVLCCRA